MTTKDRTPHTDDRASTESAEGWDAFSVWKTRVQVRSNAPEASASTGWDAFEVWHNRVKRSASDKD